GEMAAAGVLLLTDGLMPSSTGARVRRQDGKVTVKDGPFSESKELVGGFAIMKADSKEHAIELAKKFLAVAGDGEVEIRQMYDEPALVSPEVRPSARRPAGGAGRPVACAASLSPCAPGIVR